jgi:serine protease Do
VLVSQVEKGSPADKAGIEPGDVIVKVNGKAVQDSSELPAQIADLKPGASASLEIIRKGTTKNVEVTIGTLKDNKVAAKPTGQAEGPSGAARPLAPASGSGRQADHNKCRPRRAGIQTGTILPPAATIKDEQPRSCVQVRKHVALVGVMKRAFIPVDLAMRELGSGEDSRRGQCAGQGLLLLSGRAGQGVQRQVDPRPGA